MEDEVGMGWNGTVDQGSGWALGCGNHIAVLLQMVLDDCYGTSELARCYILKGAPPNAVSHSIPKLQASRTKLWASGEQVSTSVKDEVEFDVKDLANPRNPARARFTLFQCYRAFVSASVSLLILKSLKMHTSNG